MKKYLLIFRMDITTESAQPSPEEMEGYMNEWMNWINAISEKGQLSNGGNHLSYTSGKVLRPQKLIADGPYTVNNESVAGYIIVLAKGLDEAVEIAKECPILQGKGTSVEVRETETSQEMKDLETSTPSQ